MEVIFQNLGPWQWIGALLARLSVGLLFFLSGRGKLSNPEAMAQTMRQAGVPLAKFNSIFVPLVELICGGGLVLGLITPLCCVMLIAVMLSALATVHVPNMQSQSPTAWLGEFLYLPETLYLVILIWLMLAGPGWLSLDRWWFGAMP